MNVFRQACVLVSLCAGQMNAEETAVSFAVGEVTYIGNIRTGERSASVNLRVTGIDPARVRAVRITIANAEDETGAKLKQAESPAFARSSVGRVSGDNSLATSRESSASFGLEPIANSASSVRVVEGSVELFVPDLDPAATFVVARILGKLDSLHRAPGEGESPVTFTVYDKALSENYRANPVQGRGPEEYDGGPMFGHAYDATYALIAKSSPEMAKQFAKSKEIPDSSLIVGIDDPGNRLVTLEFQSGDGGPLLYNHNGNYHSSGAAGKRLDSYQLRAPIPDDVRMACWLITTKSVVRVPLKLTNIPLPPMQTPGPKPAPARQP